MALVALRVGIGLTAGVDYGERALGYELEDAGGSVQRLREGRRDGDSCATYTRLVSSLAPIRSGNQLLTSPYDQDRAL